MLRKLIISALITVLMTLGWASSTNSKTYLLGETCSAEQCQRNVLIYGEIEQGEIIEFLNAAAKTKNTDYEILIMSPGGSALDTLGIMQRLAELKTYGNHITTKSMTTAYSGGAFVWLMGDTRIAHRGDMFMFHTIQIYDQDGNKIDIKDLSKEFQELVRHRDMQMRQLVLGAVKDTRIVNLLFKKDKDVWLSAEQLYQLGLVDKLL